MKRPLLISLLIFLSFLSFGQKIHLTDSTNSWTFLSISEGPGGPYIYSDQEYYSGDTVVNGNKYRKFSGSCLREDTNTHKVYLNTLYPDSTDILLYDYNLQVDDTLSFGVNTSGSGHDTSSSWVILIDSTQINGLWYKIWYFKGYYMPAVTYDPYYYTVIEGIGCINGIGFPLDKELQYGNPSEQLTCFENNGTIYPLSKPVPDYGLISSYDFNFDNATSCEKLGVNQINSRSKTCSLFPNPINESSKIVLPYNITSGSLVIVNDVGQEIINMPFQNKEELLIGDQIKVPGIYCYRVRDNQSGATFSGKFVHE